MNESLQNFKCGRWKRNFRLIKYYVIDIFKLEYLCYLLSDWYQIYFIKKHNEDDFYFVKKKLFYVTSCLAYMTLLNFHLRISLLFFVELSNNLIRMLLVVHVTSGHIQYHVTLKVILTFEVNVKVNAYSFFVFFSIYNSVNSWMGHFTFSTVFVEKKNFRLTRYYVINLFKLEYLIYLLSDWD